MTISEHELDERLRAFGDELDRQSDRHVLSERSTETRRRIPLVIAAALVAVAVGGLAVLASTRDRSPDPVVPATQPSPEPDVQGGRDAWALPASTACLRSLERFIGSDIPAEAAANIEWPSPDTAHVVVFDVSAEPSQVRILIVDANAGFTCKTGREATADATVQGDLVDNEFGPLPTTPAANEIELVSATGTSPNLGVGPGSTLYIGRSGTGVTAVEAVLPEGDRQPGVISDGWFTIDVDVPAGVELFSNDQIAWTSLTEGERVERVDLLDEQTAAERCAAEAGCVERRLEALTIEAAATPSQAQTLADGLVTDDERRVHQEAYIDCLVNAGIDATITPNGHGHVITEDATTNPGQPGVDLVAAQADCGEQHLRYVAEAFDLVEAQSRIAPD